MNDTEKPAVDEYATCAPGGPTKGDAPAPASFPTEGEAGADPFATAPPSLATQGTPSSAPSQPSSPDADPALRFRVLQLHAKGGLGQVSVAHDSELHREVALKEIQNRFADDRDSRERFLREARITGRLEHPGIVPVYGLGHYDDGRPYYAMRFIKGDSLKEAIEAFHQAEGPGRDPGQRALDLHKLLGRFIGICNAIAYAHSRGVLHRDLKPGNVMLGQFGETLVVDWGLAKMLTEKEGAPRPSVVGVMGDATATQMGRAIGTPQFMSPEQAAGQLDRLGPASDVYSLGATLYSLLTGQAPMTGDDVGAIIGKVVHGDFPPPRRVKHDVPRPLEAICLKAMALKPEDRYASAQDLATDVESWMAEEPVSAWREPWHMRARRWVRRHRTLVTACGTAAAVALVSLVGVLLIVRAARQREEQRVAGLRTEAQKLVYAGEAATKVQDWPNANLHLASALAQIGAEPALADLKETAEELRAQTLQHLAARAARQQAQEQHQQFQAKRDDALFHYGTLFTSTDAQANLKDTDTAIRDALRLLGVTVEGHGPLPRNDQHTKAEGAEIAEGAYGLLLVLAEVKAQAGVGQPPEKQHAAAREALRVLDRAAEIGTPSQAYHLRHARYLELLGDNDQAKKESALARTLKPVHATDYFLLGDEWYKRGRLTEATAAFDQALRLQPDHFWAQFFLALRYLEGQRPAEARATLTSCLSLRPEYPWLYVLRGIVHGGAGDFALAEADFEQALKLNPSPEARHVLWAYRSGMRQRQGKVAEAMADLQQALSLMQDRPTTAAYRRLQARLAMLRQQPQDALRHLDAAIKLDPADSPDLANDQLERGRLLFTAKRYADAAKACATVLEIRPDLSEACVTQVRSLLELGQSEAAAQACDSYLEKGTPIAEIYRLRAKARTQQGDHAGAVDDLSRYLVAGGDASLYVERGWAYFECQAWHLALRDFQEALRLEPTNDFALNGRALGYAYTGQHREAVKDGEAALKRAATSSVRHFNIACVYAVAAAKAAGDAKEPDRQALAGRYRARAVELLHKSLELLPEADRPAFWRDTVQKDAALDDIRKEPGYLKLDKQYGPAS